MRRIKKSILYLGLTIGIVNMPPISEVLSLLFYDTVGIPFEFISKDTHFYATGDLKKISASESYKTYIHKFPNTDHKLYRCFRKVEWQYFFLWRIFLTNSNWLAPYISDPFFLSQYSGDYDTWFNETPRPYKWDDKTSRWIMHSAADSHCPLTKERPVEYRPLFC